MAHTQRTHTHTHIQSHLRLFGSICWPRARIFSLLLLSFTATFLVVEQATLKCLLLALAKHMNKCYFIQSHTHFTVEMLMIHTGGNIYTTAGICMWMENISEWITSSLMKLLYNTLYLSPASQVTPTSLLISCLPPLTLLLLHSDNPHMCWIIYILSFI